MAARLPVSATAVAYQIKAAWASKIHVLYWPASATQLHRLRPGDTVTTLISRAASSATYNSTDGLIEGDNDATYFTDSIAGGYGGLKENDAFTFGASWYGDLFNGVSDVRGIASVAPPNTFQTGLDLKAGGYTLDWKVAGGGGNNSGGAASDDALGLMTIAVRHDQSDATAKIRPWLNGSEITSARANATPSATDLIGDTGRPLYIGGSWTGTGNTKAHFEFAFFADALSDADMATITSDPASVIEVAGSPPAAPTIGTTTAIGNTGATINWTDNSADETGFKVEWSPSPYSSWTAASNSPAAANATSLAITGLSPATTYKARVAATNANGDSAWVETATFTTTNTVRKLKLKIDASAAGATNISGVVWAAQVGAIAGAEIGEFTGQAFEAALEGGQAVLKVPVSAFGGGSLTVSDTPVALVRNATNTSGIVSCTVIEE
jgi:hypothetical protein